MIDLLRDLRSQVPTKTWRPRLNRSIDSVHKKCFSVQFSTLRARAYDTGTNILDLELVLPVEAARVLSSSS